MKEDYSQYAKKECSGNDHKKNIGQIPDESDTSYIEKFVDRILKDNGMSAFREERRKIFMLIVNELLDIGMPIEQVELFIKTETEKNNAVYRDETKNFPEESKKDFDIFFLEKQKEQLKLTKQEFFEYKRSKILDSNLPKPVDVKQDSLEDKNICIEKNKHKIWFKIGLLFATGEMDKLLKQFNGNSTQIAKYLGDLKGLRPYISESIGIITKKSNKNIFSSRKKMEEIILYCEASNIPVIQSFKDRIPLE